MSESGGDVPLRVLVVDDDAALRFALEEGLAAHGFEVLSADGPATAYTAVAEHDPHVVLLDRRLGGDADGLATCRELRARHPACAVVMLTGSDEADDRRAALDAGASAHITKGTPLETLAGELVRVAGAAT